MRSCDTHAFDLAAPHAQPRQPGNKADLHTANHTVRIRNSKQLIWVGDDRLKRTYVSRTRRVASVFAPLPRRIIRQQRDDRAKIIPISGAKSRHVLVSKVVRQHDPNGHDPQQHNDRREIEAAGLRQELPDAAIYRFSHCVQT